MKKAKKRDSCEIKTLSASEINSIHEWMANMYRGFGLAGDELDQAIAVTFKAACMVLDAHRAAKHEAVEAKRAHLRVVE